MEFGKVKDPGLFGTIDLSLPEDHPSGYLYQAPRPPAAGSGSPRVFVGLPIWNDDELAAMIYPPRTPKNGRLREYALRFNAIELNTSGYGLAPANVGKWVGETPKGFRFYPKVPREVSHGNRLASEETGARYLAFCETAGLFGDKLGLAFLQLPESFGPDSFRDLRAFLRAHGRRLPLAVEVRHPGWFQPGNARDTYFGLLAELGITAIIDDTPGRRDALHQRLTTPEAFIRFSGFDPDDPRDRQRIRDWAERLKRWTDRGLTAIHFFAHHDPREISAVWAAHFLMALNGACGLDLPRPKLRLSSDRILGQLDLFGACTD